MAGNWKSKGIIASLGNRVVKQIWTVNYTSSRFAPASKATHKSAYEKNLDDQVGSTVVPDDVIQPQSDKYWAPHPQTGVFGPATEKSSGAGAERGLSTSPAEGGHKTVLEENAWFRPTSLEDLDKPNHV